MFRLYQKEEDTLPFADYQMIMDEVRRIGAKTALEFGPGYTTLALIEAGVEKIVSLESDGEWLEKKRDELRIYPQVHIAHYNNSPVVTADPIAEQGVFDIAIVDAPAGFHYPIPGRKPRVVHPGQEDCSRLNTCLFALGRAPVVLLHDARRPLERGTLGRLNAMGHRFKHLGTPEGPKVRIARITRNANQNQFGSQGPEEFGGAPARAEP